MRCAQATALKLAPQCPAFRLVIALKAAKPMEELRSIAETFIDITKFARLHWDTWLYLCAIADLPHKFVIDLTNLLTYVKTLMTDLTNLPIDLIHLWSTSRIYWPNAKKLMTDLIILPIDLIIFVIELTNLLTYVKTLMTDLTNFPIDRDRPHECTDQRQEIDDRPHHFTDRSHNFCERPHRINNRPHCKTVAHSPILTLITRHTNESPSISLATPLWH